MGFETGVRRLSSILLAVVMLANLAVLAGSAVAQRKGELNVSNDALEITYEGLKFLVTAKDVPFVGIAIPDLNETCMYLYDSVDERLILHNGIEINTSIQLSPATITEMIFSEPTLEEFSQAMELSISGYRLASSVSPETLRDLRDLLGELRRRLEDLNARSILRKVRRALNKSISEAAGLESVVVSGDLENVRSRAPEAFAIITSELGYVIQVETRLQDIKRDFQRRLEEEWDAFQSFISIDFREINWRIADVKPIKADDKLIGYFFKIESLNGFKFNVKVELRGRAYLYDVVEDMGGMARLNVPGGSMVVELYVKKLGWAGDILNRVLGFVDALPVKERRIVLVRRLTVVEGSEPHLEGKLTTASVALVNNTVELGGISAPGLVVNSSATYAVAFNGYLNINGGLRFRKVGEFSYARQDGVFTVLLEYPVHNAFIDVSLLTSSPEAFNPSYEVRIEPETGYIVGSEPWYVSILRIFQYDPAMVVLLITAILLLASVIIVKTRYYP